MSLKDKFAGCERIVSFGCSFTFGDELSDIVRPGPFHDVDHKKPSNLTYAALVANHCEKPYLSKAISGGSNDQIVRLLCNHIRECPRDGIVIGWTSTIRTEYCGYELGHQTFLTGGDYRQAVIDKPEWGIFQKAHTEIMLNTPREHCLDTLTRNIFLVQHTLKQMNIPFVMINAFSDFPYRKNDLVGLDFHSPQSLYEWSESRLYAKGPYGHPLDEAHAKYAAELIRVYDEKTA